MENRVMCRHMCRTTRWTTLEPPAGASSDHVQLRIEINPMTMDSVLGWDERLQGLQFTMGSHPILTWWNFPMVNLSVMYIDLAGKVSPWMPSQKKVWSCFFPGNSPLFFLVSIPFLLVKSPDCLCVFCTLFNLMRKVFQNTNHGHRVNNFWWITRGMVKPVACFSIMTWNRSRSPAISSDLQRHCCGALARLFFWSRQRLNFWAKTESWSPREIRQAGRRTGCSMADADLVKCGP